MARGRQESTRTPIYDLASNPVNGSQHCSKKDSATKGADCLPNDRKDDMVDFGHSGKPFLILKVRHPAVTGVYWIVGAVVVMISNFLGKLI